MRLSSRRFGCRRIIKKPPGLHWWSALWKMAWKNQYQDKNDEPLHCARLGNVCIRSSTSISLKETGSVCVWQKRKGLTGTGRTQRGQFWVSGIGLVPLQWWWFLVRSSFLPTLADDWHRQPPQCYQRHDSNLAADLLRANQQTQTNDFRPTPRLPHKWISNLSFWQQVMVASGA